MWRSPDNVSTVAKAIVMSRIFWVCQAVLDELPQVPYMVSAHFLLRLCGSRGGAAKATKKIFTLKLQKNKCSCSGRGMRHPVPAAVFGVIAIKRAATDSLPATRKRGL